MADFELDNLKEVEKYKTKWNIREEEYKPVILTDILELVIIELPKYVRYAEKEKKENLNLWLKFIKNPEVKIMENNEDEKSVKETKQGKRGHFPKEASFGKCPFFPLPFSRISFL